METKPTLGLFYERRREQSHERVAPPRNSIQSMAAMIAEFMLWLSVATDKKAGRRAARKTILMSRWMQLSGDALKVPMPGVLLL